MNQTYLDSLERHGMGELSQTLPPQMAEIFIKSGRVVRGMVGVALMGRGNQMDSEDCEAEALEYVYTFIRTTLRANPSSQWWMPRTWMNLIRLRVKDAITEHNRNATNPIKLPRPLRFSTRLYHTALAILLPYLQDTWYPQADPIFDAVMHQGCLAGEKRCGSCSLAVKECVQDTIKPHDLTALRDILYSSNSSLTTYGLRYRKSVVEWIETIEEALLLNHDYQFEIEEEAAYHPTFNQQERMVMRDLARQLNHIHPDLFTLYCSVWNDGNVDKINTTLHMPTPGGWSSRYLQQDYGLDHATINKLIARADRVLNRFRADYGLAPLVRKKHA